MAKKQALKTKRCSNCKYFETPDPLRYTTGMCALRIHTIGFDKKSKPISNNIPTHANNSCPSWRPKK